LGKRSLANRIISAALPQDGQVLFGDLSQNEIQHGMNFFGTSAKAHLLAEKYGDLPPKTEWEPLSLL
jgi:hypothetical protein